MLKANVKVTGQLEDFVRTQVSENGLYETTSEYFRDLVRQDMRKKEKALWKGLHDELAPGMSAPHSSFEKVTAADVIQRNKRNV